MSEKVYTNIGPKYTTQAKYEEAKQAGTRIPGKEYHIIDWEAQEKLVNQTNIKSVNNQTLLGSGNLQIDVPTKTSQLQNDGDGTNPFLTQHQSLKTVNGSTITGEGNVEIKTYQPFPNGSLSGTLQEVVQAIMAFPGKAQGMAYLGGISGSCTPFGYGNVECKVEFNTSTIALLTVSSSNIYPYYWTYNTAQGDYLWKKFVVSPKENDLSTNGDYTYTVTKGDSGITYEGWKLLQGGGGISTIVTGDAQGQYKIDGTNVNVNGLGTSDSPSFKSITANANTSENKEHRFIIENTTTNESSAMWASDSEGTPFSSLYYGKSSVVEGNDVYDYSIVCSGVEAEADMPKGSLISFQHNVIHEGEPVSNDVSYACCYYDSESETAVFKAKATDDTNYSEIEVVKNGCVFSASEKVGEGSSAVETKNEIRLTKDDAQLDTMGTNNKSLVQKQYVDTKDSIVCKNTSGTSLGNIKFVPCTTAEYEALATKDSNTLYIITD